MHKNINVKSTILLLAICLIPIMDAFAQQPYASNSRLADGTWYKIPISQTGIYKLTTSDLADLSGIPCSKIALYGSDGMMLYTSNSAEHPDDMVPAAIEIVDQNGNGTFDTEDYLLFYAEGANVWRYASQSNRFQYHVHAYANNNYYYLNLENAEALDQGLRLTTAQQLESNSPDITVNTFAAVYGEENINTDNSGQIWFSDKYTNSIQKRNYTITVPGLNLSNPVKARFGLATVSTSSSDFKMQVGSETRTYTFTSGTMYETFLAEFTSQSNNEVRITCSYTPRENNANGYLDFIELNCDIPLARTAGQNFFHNSKNMTANSISRFVVQGNGTGVSVWDVTSPSAPVKQILQNNGNSFSFIAATSQARSFVAFTLADAISPSGITAIENQNIHGSDVPEYVIVSHPDFLPQAQRLAQLHQEHEGLKTMIVTPEEVYNEFSSGKQDPVAIRQMMRCLRAKSDNPANPRYLLLFGKGSFDNRDIQGKGLRTVVTYETSNTFDNDAYPSDDIYGYLDDFAADAFSGNMSVSIGRLPASTVEEATHLVDKIDGYMNRRDLSRSDIRGDWRNYVTLLADDADPSCPYDTNFASDSETTAKLIKRMYPNFNIDRIYADAYPQQSGADGSYYPDVNNALNQRMDYGCLLLNYIGHGSSDYIGTERYMQIPDIERYANTDRLPFFVTSTCSFGRYDLNEGRCGAEAFVLAKAAGIGIVSAARPIVHLQNFNTKLCLYSLNPENSIGDALRQAKNEVSTSHCIALMGDPALRLSIPKNEVVVTKINGRPANPETTDSAEVLSRVTIEGEIHDEQGNILNDFDGSIYPIVFDRETKCHTLANDNDSSEVYFSQQKSILFKGHSTVSDGRFSYSFIIPRDVAYQYDFAKLSHYARSENADASGQYGNIMFGGFNEDLVINEIHPNVALYISDTNFRNGSITNETPTIYAILTDSVGINAAGSGLGHDITAIVDGNPYSSVTLNDFFESDIADSRNGEVRYTLGKLDEGEHTVTLKCWNIYNYSGSATIHFRVANDRSIEIGKVSAAPNPAHDRTTLRIEHNQPGNLASARLEIYDMRGSLVRQFDIEPSGSTCTIAIPWDFTASNGSKLPRGIYVAKAVLSNKSGNQQTQITKVVRN